MNLSQILLSALRTFVPWLMGFILPWATANLGWTDHDVELVVNLVVGGVYYLASRLLERYVSPNFGWLLGAPLQPVYAKVPAGADAAVTTSTVTADERYRK
jgi:hypothetical protein